jgi:hypothetical protein
VEGIKTVLKLRSEYGQPKKELTDPSRYYDLSYYERELRARAGRVEETGKRTAPETGS